VSEGGPWQDRLVADRLMLLDTASLYFRAFYGVPDSIRRADGTPVNAVRGLLDIIARLVSDYEPTHLVACWDDDWRPHWRVELIPSYKAHRVARFVPGGPDVEETPDPLEAQIPMIRALFAALEITVIGAADHEADDVIGSLATQAELPVDVVTGDRDLFQLVDDARDVRVIYTARGMSKLEVLTDVSVVSKYGVLPSQYADFAVMRGDSSDGLPGVAGIGEKTAARLLQQFVDLDGIIAAAADLEVAPTVVEVVRDLDVDEFDARIRPLDAARRSEVERLAAEWNLGGSAQRALHALGNELAQ
jgi:5'-3' exonuclease